jgi:hypothetical protein
MVLTKEHMIKSIRNHRGIPETISPGNVKMG